MYGIENKMDVIATAEKHMRRRMLEKRDEVISDKLEELGLSPEDIYCNMVIYEETNDWEFVVCRSDNNEPILKIKAVRDFDDEGIHGTIKYDLMIQELDGS